MNTYEQKIIGGVLANLIQPSAVALEPADFTDTDLGDCLRAARVLEADKIRIDPEILCQRMANTDSFYTAQDFKLMQTAVNSASVVYEAIEKVKSTALKTFLLEKTAEIALQSDRSSTQLLDALKAVIDHADNEYRSTENNFVLLKDILQETEAIYRDLHSGVSYAISTGFPLIDALLLDGFTKGDEHILVGFTGSGKTALALNMAMNQAKAGNFVGFVSREMSAPENVMRLIASDTGIERWKMRKGMFDNTLDDLLRHMSGGFNNLPIAFDTRTVSVEELRPQVRQMVEKNDLRILYVDYLQLMTSNGRASTRADEVQKISRTLKLIAMENKIPVVSLCQFNRGAANADVFSIMAHLKESSAIEQDASTISYVQIEKTDTDNPIRGAQITVLKNRNGSTFRPVNLDYHGATFTFTEAAMQ